MTWSREGRAASQKQYGERGGGKRVILSVVQQTHTRQGRIGREDLESAMGFDA